jgi:thiosulfate/3-mercaptopyruvate sulfurtransferase
MMPTVEEFTNLMKDIDVRKHDKIVVYDKIGMVSAPRAFWLLKTFGLHNVRVLNGAFPKWDREQRAIESGETPQAWKKHRNTNANPNDFQFELSNNKVKFYEDIIDLLNDKS